MSMKITIYNNPTSYEDLEINKLFGLYLADQIKELSYESLNTEMFNKYSEYLGFDVIPHVKNVLNNLEIKATYTSLIIGINKRLKISNVNSEQVLRFIEYGNLSIKGDKTIANIFKSVGDNINLFWETWNMARS